MGAGVAVPYGNSDVLPFEKRFYSGGANSVRGWGVRTLGPGSYNRKNISNSIATGPASDPTVPAVLDPDANTSDINNRLSHFFYQCGDIRLDFKYFLVRVDMGMKAHNPASGEEHWPMFKPVFKRDSEFHFSVGYPF